MNFKNLKHFRRPPWKKSGPIIRPIWTLTSHHNFYILGRKAFWIYSLRKIYSGECFHALKFGYYSLWNLFFVLLDSSVHGEHMSPRGAAAEITTSIPVPVRGWVKAEPKPGTKDKNMAPIFRGPRFDTIVPCFIPFYNSSRIMRMHRAPRRQELF